jgi:hypothetical protein
MYRIRTYRLCRPRSATHAEVACKIIFGSPVSVPSVAHLDMGGVVRQLRSHRRWLCALPHDPHVAKQGTIPWGPSVALVHVVT